ncbi:uncharacterized protein METZ01_LOCUS506610, partial [marine metagenome]
RTISTILITAGITKLCIMVLSLYQMSGVI